MGDTSGGERRSLSITALAFDGPFPEAEYPPSVVASALLGADPPDQAAALVLRWDRSDRWPRYSQIPSSTSGGLAVLEQVFGTTFLLPLFHAANQTHPEADASPLERLGVERGFLNHLRDALVPGTSALLVLAPAAQVDALADRPDDARPAQRFATVVSHP